MPSDHDSLPNPDNLLSSWQTQETLLSQSAQPQQGRKRKHFLSVFLCIPDRAIEGLWKKWISFLMAMCGSGSCSFAVLFQCLSTGIFHFPCCNVGLRTYVCPCHSIPLSNGAAEAEGVSTEASWCGLWQAKALPPSPYHGTQCSFCCQQPQPGLLPVLGLVFEEQPHHLLLRFMQRQCRRMQDSATPHSACLWLYPQRWQHMSCERETTELSPEFLVNY